MSTDKYTVGLVSREHICMLPVVARSAAGIFPSDVFPPEVRTGAVPLKQLEAAYANGRLWTVLTKAGSPGGFAISIREPNSAFL